MKTTIIILVFALLGFFVADDILTSCRAGRDLPQADLTRFQLIAMDSVQHGDGFRYAYNWLDDDRNVTYVTYSNKNLDIPIGIIVMGLIRK